MTESGAAMQLILASQSPVRKRLLLEAGLRFSTLPAHVDESGLIAGSADRAPRQLALVLAEAKARAVAATAPDALVIGADQVLVADGEILQKPSDLGAARARLARLAGREHALVTGVVLVRGNNLVWSHVDKSVLRMHELSQGEIECQLAEEGETVLESVGAYRLEGPGIRLFASFEGDYFAMLGLPLLPLISALRRHAPALVPGVLPK